jgi:peptidyl-prolyl cis-trans isomerase C
MNVRNVLLGLLLALSLSACGDTQKSSEGLVQLKGPNSDLKVNDEAVPQALVEAYARKRGWEVRDPGQLEQVYEQLGELLAVAMAARNQGLLDDVKVQADLELERLNRLSGLMIERGVAPITEQDLRAAYDQELATTGNEEFQVAHVLVDNAERAEQVLASLNAGTGFDDVMAAEVGQSGVRDSKELGWVRRNQLPAALATALSTLAPGQWTPQAVQTEFGFHVALLRGKRPFAAPPFEKVHEAIRASLERKRALDVAKSIKAEAKIEH